MPRVLLPVDYLGWTICASFLLEGTALDGALELSLWWLGLLQATVHVFLARVNPRKLVQDTTGSTGSRCNYFCKPYKLASCAMLLPHTDNNHVDTKPENKHNAGWNIFHEPSCLTRPAAGCCLTHPPADGIAAGMFYGVTQ